MVITVADASLVVGSKSTFFEKDVLPVPRTPQNLLSGVFLAPHIFALAAGHVPLELLVRDNMLSIEGTSHLQVCVEVHSAN